MRRAVVTGAPGPVAAAVIAHLAEAGWSVEAWCDAEGPLYRGPGAQGVAVDFAQPVALERRLAGVSALFHLRRERRLGARLRDTVYRVNVEETALLLTAARVAGVGSFVYQGSIFGLGAPSPDGRVDPWDLRALPIPLVQGDRLALLEAQRQASLGLALSIVTPTFLLGPGVTEGLALALRAIVSGRAPALPRCAIGVTDPRDLATALVRAAEAPPGEHLFPGTPVPWGALAEALTARSGRGGARALLPPPLLDLVARLAPGHPLTQGLRLMGRSWDYGAGGALGVTPRPWTESLTDWWDARPSA